MDLVRLLVWRGADIHFPGGKYGSVLQATVASGHENVINFLFEQGVDVNQQGGFYHTALHAATLLQRDHVLDLPLQHQADPNSNGGCGGSVLNAAVIEGNENAVRRLREYGANAKTLEKGGTGSALVPAVLHDSGAILHLLLDAGADLNADCGE